jgi:hypothetical protein
VVMHVNAKSKVFYIQLDGSTYVLQPRAIKHTPHWRNPTKGDCLFLHGIHCSIVPPTVAGAQPRRQRKPTRHDVILAGFC